MMATYLAASFRNRSLSPTRISRQLESVGVMTSSDVRYVSNRGRPLSDSSGTWTGMRDLADFSAVGSVLAGNSDEFAAVVVQFVSVSCPHSGDSRRFLAHDAVLRA